MINGLTTRYFDLIHNKLSSLVHYPKEVDDEDEDEDDRANAKLQIQRYKIDVRILKMFCFCFEARYYFTDEQGKERKGKLEIYIQGKENWRSIYTDLRPIWVELERNELKDFDPVTFGLERKIQQSKPLIQQWCEVLMQMKSKPPANRNFIKTFVDIVLSNVVQLSMSEIVPFKNQIDILTDKLRFMHNSLERVHECTDSNELLEYINFVRGFPEKAACLVCMYWAKEANEENAIEMNVLLFDLLHKIKPCAAHVTASYFAVVKSNNLLHSDESIFEGLTCEKWQQTPATFVDFFFEHTVLEDVFLILRERLIPLFTFLADAQEEDVIRSQIYALFHEDSYLLLPINEMKEDLSNKKMLLSDFTIKIDILTANIIQFNCRPSESWNRLEAEKMNNIYFASLQRELSTIKHTRLPDQVRAEVHLYIMEIRFLRLFFQCFETWDDSDEETRVRLSSMVTSLQLIWGQEYDMVLLLGRLYSIRKENNIEDLEHLLDLELKEKVHMSKQEINAWLVSLSHCSFHYRPSRSNKILKFLDYILYNMRDLVSRGACKDVPFKKQNEILEEKLFLLKNLLKLATNCADNKNLKEFNMLAQVFASNTACLIYLFWAKEADEDIPAETNLMFSNMLQKIKPDTPDVARTYIGTLKAICLQPYDYFLLEQTAMSFVDYFFEDLTIPWKNGFQIHRDEVNFLLTFVHHHHHTGNAEEIICSQLDVLFNDDVYDLLPFNDMKGDLSKKEVGLSDFMMNIRTKNAKIRHLYCKFPDSIVLNYPRIIGQGFLDSLIQKLRNLMERMISDPKYVPCAKYKMKAIEEELLSLTPIFNQILELKDLNEAWLEVVNVVYLAEHVISSCHIFYHLIWHYIPYLFDVEEKIKAIRTKLENIEECDMCNSRCLPHSTGLVSTPLLQQDQTSEIHGVLVGFKDDEKIIIDNIMGGTKSLDIVSIVGMGGLGKTTLAKKVYGSSSVKSHFHIFAFTYVMQYHDKKRLLLDILKNIVEVDAKTSCMTEDDLAHKLKNCLSRRKYFIVLDDIWDTNVWDEVRSSFPDDRNGSRIMFTTRFLEVANRGKIKCNPHRLRFLSKDESWELLQKKVFYNDMPLPSLSSVAKLIAKQCGGLPLAIVVIAGILARTETSLWIDISESVSSYLLVEGCMNILELSYKHLPEYLKPCLIYLGAFPEDRSYKVRQVTLLWIAEGFIMESKTKSLNDVAKEYLYELVDRSLIIVDKMTIDEIRTFRVHDLRHDFCQKKCRDENFFQIGHGNATSSFSAPSIYKHYRVSMQKLSDITVDDEPSLANTRSLLYFPSQIDYFERIFPLRNFRFAQVLYLEYAELQESDFAHMFSLVDLRHIEAEVPWMVQSIPSSIANLWNVQSLILMNGEEIDLPETLWRMKSLRHVKVRMCKLNVSDGYELNAYPQLDKVVSFSCPSLSTRKDVEWLLQRLPAVRELGCILSNNSLDCIEERVETLDFHRKLESLKLCKLGTYCSYLIKFPSTLIKLTLDRLQLSWTAISEIAELQCLRILKLRGVPFPGPSWEMEDVKFPNLKYFELSGTKLELWNADTASFPCLEQLFFGGTSLEELPPCFGESTTLKKIIIQSSSPKLKSSAWRVQEEQRELGNKVELWMCVGFSEKFAIREKDGDIFGCVNAENGFDINVLGADLSVGFF